MAGCELSQRQIEQVVDFHGHWCPGLAIGMRAGEYALREMGRAEDEEIVAVVETDMCGVDAIQMLTGCTFGKGNLLHRDHGKMAFSFFRRADGRGVRLVFEPSRLMNEDEAFAELNNRWLKGELDQAEEEKLMRLREERGRAIMSAPLDDLFSVKEPEFPMPRAARVLRSLVCEQCGEGTMESRTRRLEGRTLCIPCFEALESGR
jgi:formylmethanofuran dehydrogenase subunit E